MKPRAENIQIILLYTLVGTIILIGLLVYYVLFWLCLLFIDDVVVLNAIPVCLKFKLDQFNPFSIGRLYHFRSYPLHIMNHCTRTHFNTFFQLFTFNTKVQLN